MVDDLFVALGIDKGEYLHDVERGDSSVASFMASVEECSIISERECKLYNNLIPISVTLQCSCVGLYAFSCMYLVTLLTLDSLSLADC